MTRLLSKQDVKEVLTMNETIEILEKAFANLSTGQAVMQQRTPIPTPDHSGLALFMPAYLKGEWRWEKVHGSLGDVITNKIPGRENADEITLFKSAGLAIQDISTAFHVYRKAEESGIGSEFEF